MRMFLTALCLFAMGHGFASAKGLRVLVQNQDGLAIPNAVVAFSPSAAAELNSLPAETLEITQKDIQFNPLVTIAPVGSTVEFKNEDSVLHHVFSFSKAKRFDLKLFGNSETQSVEFDTPGIVSVGCNIHDGMASYIYIPTTPFAIQTNTEGVAEFAELPEGEGTLSVWHPLLRAKRNSVSQTVTVGDAQETLVVSEKFRKGARPDNY